MTTDIGKYEMRVSELCESQADLDEITRQAEELGVAMEAFWDGDQIWLHEISNSGPKGSGRKALEMLLRYADQVGLPVRGSAVAFNSQLLDWYARLGFRVVDGSEDDDYVVIERRPKAQQWRPNMAKERNLQEISKSRR